MTIKELKSKIGGLSDDVIFRVSVDISKDDETAGDRAFGEEYLCHITKTSSPEGKPIEFTLIMDGYFNWEN